MSIHRIPEHDLKFLGPTQVVFHCHHFNLFLDQTIGDALGPDGATLRRLAARQAASELLSGLMTPEMTPVERLEVAKNTFAAMGHGTLNFEVDGSSGEVRSRTLHYGTCWKEKYGQTVKCVDPVDDFAAGFVAAATALAFGKGGESLEGEEVECVARRETRCRFQIKESTTQLPASPPVNIETVRPYLTAPITSVREEEVTKITDGLNTFLGTVKPDDRGLIEAFGVYVTLHVANYYNRISFDAMQHVNEQDAEFHEAFQELLRESGHVCVFNTFGGIIASPEWEGLVGPPSGDPEEIVVWCMAIARALGFGRWSLTAFDEGKRLEVAAPANYEGPYFRIRHGIAEKAPEYFFQGAVVAIMQLAHRVAWKDRPRFTQEEYQRLFVGGESPWNVTQNKSGAMGDSHSAVVVTS